MGNFIITKIIVFKISKLKVNLSMKKPYYKEKVILFITINKMNVNQWTLI